MSKRVYLLGVGSLMVAGALLLTGALLRAPGVTAATVKRVQPGMTSQQVEDLLGEPTYVEQPPSARPFAQRFARRHQLAAKADMVLFIWVGQGGELVMVRFSDGEVRSVMADWDRLPSGVSLFSGLRACFGW